MAAEFGGQQAEVVDHPGESDVALGDDLVELRRVVDEGLEAAQRVGKGDAAAADPLGAAGDQQLDVLASVGVEAAEDLKALVPAGASLTQLALRWILDHDGVSTVIAGARTSDQVRDNAAASDLPPLPDTTHTAIETLYRERIAPQVHQRW